MNIFNSLGSNYNFSFVIRSLLSFPGKHDLQRLETYLEERYGGKAILFYKGREAITAELEALGLPKDSEVAINGFTCVAVFNAIRKAGLEPACVDLEDAGGLNFTPETLEHHIKNNKKIRAVIVQNTLGYPCDIEKIESICKKHKLILIEDLAHSIGTRYSDGREAGTVGDAAILSFSQDKIIDAVSGGALVARNSKVKIQNAKFKLKIQKFEKDRYYPLFTYIIRSLYPIVMGKLIHFILKHLGLLSDIMDESLYNYYALPALNAKLALSEFKRLDAQIAHRRKIAEIYIASLPGSLFMFDKNKTQRAVNLSANLRFPIFVKNRENLLDTLKKRGVHLSDIWYVDVEPSCPNAVADSKIILNLPTHINVSEKAAQEITRIINLWLK